MSSALVGAARRDSCETLLCNGNAVKRVAVVNQIGVLQAAGMFPLPVSFHARQICVVTQI